MHSFLLVEWIPCFSMSLVPVQICITCNRQIQEAIFNSTFYPNLFAMLSPFMVLGVIVTALSILSTKRYKASLANGAHTVRFSSVPLTTAAMVLGIGLGGFIDGIALHQILQWHEMLSNKIPPTTLVAKSVNMFWDGIFHAFTLLVTITGVVLLWRLLQKKDINRSGNVLAGGLLLGWGLFNIVEGLADHHLLKLHNVRENSSNVSAWNISFLILSILLLIAGWQLVKAGTKAKQTI